VKPVLAVVVALSLIFVVAKDAQARGKGCAETSDVVGYEVCTRYGDDWSADRMFPVSFSLDLWDGAFDPNGRQFAATPCKDCSGPSFKWSGTGTRLLETKGAGLRADAFLFGPVYAGLRIWAVGFGTNAVGAVAADGTTLQGNGNMATWSWVPEMNFGVRVPLGRLSLRLEAVLGAQIMWLDQSSTSGTQYSSGAVSTVIEPRAIVDVWATPNLTMSVYAGVNFLDSNERDMGVLFGWHLRSFDGAFALW
jgi:hypothetical protein